MSLLAKLQAQFLRNPDGLVGRFVLAPLWNRRNAAMNDAAFECLRLRADDRVLEVGFGGGYLLGRMAAVVTEGFLAGVDVSPAMVAFCERRFRSLVPAGRLELRCASAESIPYAAGRFTKACSVNSIFYWRDPGRAAAEILRVLQAGGEFVLCFTSKESLAGRGFTRYGVTAYELDEVEQLLRAAGFGETDAARSADRHREFWCVTAER